MEALLLESYKSLGKEIEELVREKDENQKALNTKFHETAQADIERISNRLREIHEERRSLEVKIIDIRKKNFEENFLLISKECGTQPVEMIKANKIDLATYSKNAAQNLNNLYSSSDAFSATLVRYLKRFSGKNEFYFDLFTTPREFPYSLILRLKDNILSFSINGYGDENNDYSEDSRDSDILQQKLIIKMLEEKESTLRFFFQEFWKREERIY